MAHIFNPRPQDHNHGHIIAANRIRISLSMHAAFDHHHQRADQIGDLCLFTLIGRVLMRPKPADRTLPDVASKTTQRTSAHQHTAHTHTRTPTHASQPTSFRHPQAHTRATSAAEKFARAAAEQRSLIPTPRPSHPASTRRVVSRRPTAGAARARHIKACTRAYTLLRLL